MTISQLRRVHSRAIVRRRDWKATAAAGREAAITLENTLVRQSRQMVMDRIEQRRGAPAVQ